MFCGGTAPGKAKSASPWPILAAAWLGSMPVARVSHWGTQRGAVGLGEELAPTWVARRWWRNAGEHGRAPRVRFTRRTLAQQKGETKRRLTRLGNGPWRDTTAQAARFGGEVGAVFAGGSQVCDFGLPGPTDRLEGSLR